MKIKIYVVFLLFIGVFLAFADNASASVTYQTPSPILETELSALYSTCCSFEDNYKEWFYIYKLPNGITMSQIQMAVDVTTGSNLPLVVDIYGDDNNNLDVCDDFASCTAGDTFIQNLFTGNATQITGDLVTANLATTTTISGNLYLRIGLTPQGYTYTASLFKQDSPGTFTACSPGSFGTQNCSDTWKQGAISMRLCDANCPITAFSPLPTVTESPWARLTKATPRTSDFSVFDLEVQVNTGTTTADNIVIEYESDFQNLVPDEYDLTVTGLNVFNFTKNFPAIQDTITVRITMYQGTSTIIYVSPDYTFDVIPKVNTDTEVDPEGVNCESFNTLSKPFCVVLVYLFIPGQNSLDRFGNLYTELDTIKPFGYFTVALNTIQGVDASSTPAYTMPEIPFIDAIFTPFKTAMATILWGIFLFVFYNKRLKNIDI